MGDVRSRESYIGINPLNLGDKIFVNIKYQVMKCYIIIWEQDGCCR